jgi:indolepyruvate decarboxylase
MQQLEDRGEPAWIGNCNELNAAYATDAYARINGIGAMIVTHGVGPVERAVLGKDARYNDVANWRYSELPNVFSRDNKAETQFVQTSNELQRVLDSPHSGMVFVESVMDKYDAPIDLIVGGHALADSDYGVPGPQSAANAQIPFPTHAATSS